MVKPCIAFLWSGFPDYAARQIGELIKRGNYGVVVVATKASTPVANLQSVLGQKIYWIEAENQNVTWASLGLQTPNFVFQGGWATPGFNALATEARGQGARIILMNDQNLNSTFFQKYIDPLRYQFQLHKKFDGILVPGQSGALYARHVGFSPRQIRQGLYGCDPTVFNGGAALHVRAKRLLFVGQLIERKNIIRLVRVFSQLSPAFPDWKLHVVGSGVLSAQIPRHDRVEISGFLQAPQLAEKLCASRVLVLPSYDEHWGLVVHEAAACGCGLLLSTAVGSGVDLGSAENARFFDAKSDAGLATALRDVFSWTPENWQHAEAESRSLALKFSPSVFANSIASFVETLS